jgi:transcription elongation factor Elf1
MNKPMDESFTCPRCGRTSHNPNDVQEGYCGHCHDWTRAKPVVDQADESARAAYWEAVRGRADT